LSVQRRSLKTKKSSVWQRFTVWFLAVAFLAPSGWGLFHENSQVTHSEARYSANVPSSLNQAQPHSFPMDEQQTGFGELEIIVEAGIEEVDENSSGPYFQSGVLDFNTWKSLAPLGLWARIGEKNLAVPPALYLRHHALRIPS